MTIVLILILAFFPAAFLWAYFGKDMSSARNSLKTTEAKLNQALERYTYENGVAVPLNIEAAIASINQGINNGRGALMSTEKQKLTQKLSSLGEEFQAAWENFSLVQSFVDKENWHVTERALHLMESYDDLNIRKAVIQASTDLHRKTMEAGVRAHLEQQALNIELTRKQVDIAQDHIRVSEKLLGVSEGILDETKHIGDVVEDISDDTKRLVDLGEKANVKLDSIAHSSAISAAANVATAAAARRSADANERSADANERSADANERSAKAAESMDDYLWNKR